MTDPKGDRSKAPHAQKDPDMFVRVEERREDGIVVRGAKVHQTGSINSHWHIVMPTQAMSEADKDFAVSFACPTDARRSRHDIRKTVLRYQKDGRGRRRRSGQQEVRRPGSSRSIRRRVHSKRIHIHGRRIRLRRHDGREIRRIPPSVIRRMQSRRRRRSDRSSRPCAEYNGVEKASAVKDKLIEMTHLNETLYGCGIACSAEGCPTKCGSYMIDLLLANVCKQNVTRFPYEIVRLAEDIAGGLMVTMPSEKDFKSDQVVGRNGETIGEICDKYFATTDICSTEDRMRVLRFLENICLGSSAVGYRTESMHGAGSPQAQRIMIQRQGDIQGKKQLAKDIAGVKK